MVWKQIWLFDGSLGIAVVRDIRLIFFSTEILQMGRWLM
jgi:hypothetical protein